MQTYSQIAMRINRRIKAYSQSEMRINRGKRVILRSEQRIFISSAAYALIAKSKQIRPKIVPLGAQRRSCPPSIAPLGAQRRSCSLAQPPLPPQRRRKQKGRVPHGTLPSDIIQIICNTGLFIAPDVPALFFLCQRLAAVNRIITNRQALCQHACNLCESYFRLRR